MGKIDDVLAAREDDILHVPAAGAGQLRVVVAGRDRVVVDGDVRRAVAVDASVELAPGGAAVVCGHSDGSVAGDGECQAAVDVAGGKGQRPGSGI